MAMAILIEWGQLLNLKTAVGRMARGESGYDCWT